MKITFLGATGTVTGSKFLLESDAGEKILIDCGLFQGLKNLRLRNWENFPINPSEIKAILITHGHLDHIGYIPKLVAEGFIGEIYCTPATLPLAEILLFDSARLKEEDAEYANRKKFSKHKPAKPLYTEKDVIKSLKLFEKKDFYIEFKVGSFNIEFKRAGHILGAASILIKADGKSIYFSGDIGRKNDLLMPAPDSPPDVDYLVMESTYGDRLHENIDPIEGLRAIVSEVKKHAGVLMIPSFAVARAQLMLYCFFALFKKHPELKMPVYLNSPMASDVTGLYHDFIEEHSLSKKECKNVCGLATIINTVTESKQLNEKSGPMIIIAGSGMVTGGRILHHLKAFANDPNNAILLVGYQGEGTRGDALLRGEKELKIHGQYYPVAAKVHNIDAYSAHADQNELLEWIDGSQAKAKKIFLVHGDPKASDVLRRKIEESFSADVCVPEHKDSFSL